MLEFIAKKVLENHLNRQYSYIRAEENEADRADPFALVDEQLTLEGAVWLLCEFVVDVDFEADDEEPTIELTGVS